jgi:long-chain acyl-CoA synthetase
MRDTLADFFDDLAETRGEFLVHDDGFRARRYTYAQVAAAARAFARRLRDAGLRKGDHVLVWSENRPEWIAAFWGCVISGVVVVPIDYRSSAEFAGRVAATVRARIALVGEEVPAGGDASPLGGAVVWRFAEFEWAGGTGADRAGPAVALDRDDVAEVIFTSGATAEPKGVLITHGNILANIVPIEREVARYRGWGRPFFPLRFLDLLPLSHMFGQAMATFIPPMLAGTTVFMRGYSPAEIVAQVRKRRISVVVCVPKILDVLGEHVRRTWPAAAEAPAGQPAKKRAATRGPGLATVASVARRWWRHRAVHRAFGWKFWSFVVGAAPLETTSEESWSRLGFIVIQGYGLTETAPIVSLNHPFGARKGSVGKAIPGVEIRIAPDGEILVRGENVTRGYFGEQADAAGAFEDGWLHTGDIGEIDAQGQLFVRGRKKEMIVTPEGLNVFPEDVERAINEQPGVRESAVVGVARDGEERVHAVLALEAGTDPERVVRIANAALLAHQRIRGFSTWERGELPRTEGTRKLKRREIRRWVESGSAAAPPRSGGGALDGLFAKYSGGRLLRPDTTIEELGLSSLDRVELMAAIDERFQTSVDEARFAEARTVGDLTALLASDAARAPAAPPRERDRTMPSWSRGRIASAVRAMSQATVLLPLTRLFARLDVRGLEHLAAVEGPVVFAANHQSHMDTPVVLAALPRRWRRRVAVAMSKEFFAPHFHPERHTPRERRRAGLLYGLASLLFGGFPIPQHEAGARGTLRYIGELLGDGWSVLIYPEGTRSDTDAIGRFQPGVGMIGSRLSVAVIPVSLQGVNRVLHRTWRMARPGRVLVEFGPAMKLTGDDYASLARRVEEAVRGMRSTGYGRLP